MVLGGSDAGKTQPLSSKLFRDQKLTDLADRGSILVIGARNSGKTSFIEFLRSSLTLPPRKQRPHQRDDELDAPPPNQSSTNFTSHYIETEIDSERIGLTLWDSEGLEKTMVDLQAREIVAFVESKFQETLSEEIKVVRSPGGVKDPHIHCVILLLDPLNLNQTLSTARKAQDAGYNGNVSHGKSFFRDGSPETLNSLDENLDLQVLRALQGKSTVIPVISKADTITVDHMQYLKRAVWKSLKAGKFDSLDSLGVEEDSSDDDEDDSEAIEDDDEDEQNDLDATPRRRRDLPARHNGERLNEADEDALAQQQKSNLLRPDVSHLDTASSSSESSFNVTATAQQPARVANPYRQPSQGLAAATSRNEAASTPNIPFSLITPDPIVTPHLPVPGQTGRKFAWGFADPYNAEHCDFMRLREALFRDWLSEMREASREMWYEEWRATRLHTPKSGGFGRSQANARYAGASTGNANRQAMVPVGMMGNNGLASTMSASRTAQRVPSAAHTPARASPNPQAMMIPVSSEGEVGVAR